MRLLKPTKFYIFLTLLLAAAGPFLVKRSALKALLCEFWLIVWLGSSTLLLWTLVEYARFRWRLRSADQRKVAHAKSVELYYPGATVILGGQLLSCIFYTNELIVAVKLIAFVLTAFVDYMFVCEAKFLRRQLK